MCPLTVDYQAFEQSLSAVDTNIIPLGGTDLGTVIENANQILDNGANHRILIIVTDGEDLTGDALAAAKQAGEEGLTIHAVGVGTEQGELIPDPDSPGNFIKDQFGNFVTSRLDTQGLAAIAAATEGLYQPLGNSGQGLAEIYRRKLALVPKEELAERRQKIPIERFSWPLGMALALLFLDFLLGERRVQQSKRQPGKKVAKSLGRTVKSIAAWLLLSLAPLVSGSPVKASEALEAYTSENYVKASELYRRQLEKKPDDPLLQYNFGTAAHKNNLWDDAIEAFSRALVTEDLNIQEKAYFNKANSHYHKGAESVQAEPHKTLEQWQLGLEALEAVLQLVPDHQKAKQNYTFIEERLKTLEEQLEQHQQNQDQGDSGNSNQQDQQEGSDGSEQQRQDQGATAGQDQGAETDEQHRNSAQQQPSPHASGQDQGEAEEAATPAPASAASQQQGAGVREEGEPQVEGKMTREEALQLLNALRNEEGELNFVPVPGKQPENSRDW
jgi:Ca-activated chloride channel family protein